MDWSFGHKAMLVVLFVPSVLGLAGVAACGGSGGGNADEEHYIAGRELQQQNRLEEAIAAYDEAIRLNPASVRAFAGRGDAFYSQGSFRQAMQDYDQSISLKSNLKSLEDSPEYASHNNALAEAYIGRALIETVRGDDLEAQRNLAQVAEIGIDPAEAREAIEAIKAER